MSERIINITHKLNAPSKAIFTLWAEPEFIRRWFGRMDMELMGIAIDLRPGGRYSLKVETEAGPSTIAGEFLEVDPQKRLAYTWRKDGPPGEVDSTTIEVTFEEKGGETEVRLSHGPFLEAENNAFYLECWRTCFAALADQIAHHQSA